MNDVHQYSAANIACKFPLFFIHHVYHRVTSHPYCPKLVVRIVERVEKNALKFLFIMLPFSSSVSFAYLVANICDSYGFYAPERQGKLSGLDCLLVHCKFLVLTYQNWFPMPLCLISDTHICVCTHKYTQMAFEHEVFGIKHDICFLVAPCTKIPCFYLEMLFWE